MENCYKCNSQLLKKNGRDRLQKQKYICTSCHSHLIDDRTRTNITKVIEKDFIRNLKRELMKNLEIEEIAKQSTILKSKSSVYRFMKKIA